MTGMRTALHGRLAAILALAGLLAGCAGTSIESEELPAESLAFLFRTSGEAAERARLFNPGAGGADRQGVMDLQLRGRDNPGNPGANQFLGRLAFLDPVNGRPSTASFALAGAEPLAWSKDRQRLLFVAERNGSDALMEWRSDTGVVRPLLPVRREEQTAGCFGPDGWLAAVFQQGRGPNSRSEVWAIPPSGGAPLQVSAGSWDAQIACTPASPFLVIAAFDPRGALLRQVSWAEARVAGIPEGRALTRGVDPTFSSDGQWILFSRSVEGRWGLWRMRPDGSGKVAVGKGHLDERFPAVSPDGRFIAYSQVVDNRSALRVRRFDGSGDRPLLREGDGELAVW